MKQTIIALSPFQGIAPFIVSAPQGYMTTKIVRKNDKMIVTYEPIVNNISKIPVSKIAKLAKTDTKTAKMIKSSMKNLKKGKSMEEYIDEAWERNYPKMSETLDLTKKRGKKK